MQPDQDADRTLWLKSLAPDDVVELYPRAVFPGWVNIVKEARIELEYARASDQQPGKGERDSPFKRNSRLYSRPLNSELLEIRFLQIRPGMYHDPIICQFGYTSLKNESQNCPTFDALSYRWEYPETFKAITIIPDGAETDVAENLFVTPSVESAIRRLRHQSRNVNLWIDAITINQIDKDERAQQVRIMGFIFSRARTVHIWLGEDERGGSILQFIRDAHNYNDRICGGGSLCSCEGVPHTSINAIEESQSDTLSHHRAVRAIFRFHSFAHEHSIVSYLSSLFENPWFRRCWVLREVLEARSVFVHSASKSIRWKELVEVHSWLNEPGFTNPDPHNLHKFVTMPPVWSSFATLTGMTSQSTSHDDLSLEQTGILDVYLAALDLRSSEPRDKLFSLLGFGKETGSRHDLPDALQPNYFKPDQEVFAGFTKWWIKEHKSLSILSSIHGDRRRTWVRVISDSLKAISPPHPSWIVPFEGSPRWLGGTLSNKFKFRAATECPVDVGLLEDSSIQDPLKPPMIRLAGHRISQIDRKAHFPTAPGNQIVWSPSGMISEVYGKIIDPISVYHHWRVWASKTEAEAQGGDPRPSRGHLAAHWGYISQAEVDVLDHRNACGPLQKSTGVATCSDPCVFAASNGMVGLCPWMALEGDIVTLLHGGEIPFLLRPVAQETATDYGAVVEDATYFELIGECYVEGIMYGELLRELNSKGIKPEILTLV